MARCTTGVDEQATTSRTVTALGIAATAHVVAMMVLIVFALTTSAMSLKTARSTPLTPTLSVATAPLLMMILMSKGH